MALYENTPGHGVNSLYKWTVQQICVSFSWLTAVSPNSTFCIAQRDHHWDARSLPSDNLGQWNWLGSLLIKADWPNDALYFIQTWMAPEVDSSELPCQGGAGFAKPSLEPVSVARVKILSKYKMALLLYLTALGSFKFWGLPCCTAVPLYSC